MNAYPVAPVANTCECAFNVSSNALSEYKLIGELNCLCTNFGPLNGWAAVLCPLPIGT